VRGPRRGAWPGEQTTTATTEQPDDVNEHDFPYVWISQVYPDITTGLSNFAVEWGMEKSNWLAQTFGQLQQYLPAILFAFVAAAVCNFFSVGTREFVRPMNNLAIILYAVTGFGAVALLLLFDISWRFICFVRGMLLNHCKQLEDHSAYFGIDSSERKIIGLELWSRTNVSMPH
jgi:hypothetical protein